MRLRKALTVVGLLTLGIAAFADGPRMDGRWEVKIEMQMAGMTMPPQTTTQCITPDQAADPQKAMPTNGRGGNPTDCQISNYKIDGNKVSWTMACAQEKMSGSGSSCTPPTPTPAP